SDPATLTVLYFPRSRSVTSTPDAGQTPDPRSRPMLSEFEFDVIIVGGGPAGLCAAMYAGRGMLRAVLLERGATGGELLNTETIEDYPGFESILGRDLAARMTAHALKFGAE